MTAWASTLGSGPWTLGGGPHFLLRIVFLRGLSRIYVLMHLYDISEPENLSKFGLLYERRYAKEFLAVREAFQVKVARFVLCVPERVPCCTRTVEHRNRIAGLAWEESFGRSSHYATASLEELFGWCRACEEAQPSFWVFEELGTSYGRKWCTDELSCAACLC